MNSIIKYNKETKEWEMWVREKTFLEIAKQMGLTDDQGNTKLKEIDLIIPCQNIEGD